MTNECLVFVLGTFIALLPVLTKCSILSSARPMEKMLERVVFSLVWQQPDFSHRLKGLPASIAIFWGWEVGLNNQWSKEINIRKPWQRIAAVKTS